jgi:hypothetical protein
MHARCFLPHGFDGPAILPRHGLNLLGTMQPGVDKERVNQIVTPETRLGDESAQRRRRT